MCKVNRQTKDDKMRTNAHISLWPSELKRTKGQTMIYKTLQNSGVLEGLALPDSQVAPVVLLLNDMNII